MTRTTMRPTPTSNHLTTSFLLLAQYGGRAVIPVVEVCRDFFAPLTRVKFLRKVARGDIALPVIRMEASQKGAKGVHISDLAEFIDVQREAARQEMEALCGGAGIRLRKAEP